MMYCTKLLLLLIVTKCSNSIKLPNYIQTCSRSSNFNTCATENGRKAIPYVLKGDKSFKIPPLIPLTLPEIKMQAGQGLSIKVTDVKIYGLDTVYLQELGVDFGAQKVHTSLNFTRLSILGTYEVDGTLLFLNLQGNGPCNITIENVDVGYHFNYDTVKTEGNDYMHIKNDDLTLVSQKEYYKLENLFGNERLSEAMNRLINENASEITKELNGPITGVVKAVIQDMVKKYMTTVPISDLFPEN